MSEDGGQDDSQKTEDPSHKRLEDAKQKGQIPFSKEVGNFAMLLALSFVLVGAFPYLLTRIKVIMLPFISHAYDMPFSTGGMRLLFWHVLGDLAIVMMIPFAIALAAALISGGIQTRFHVAVDRITPKLEKISIMKGIGRLFSMKNLVEFIKGLIKISIVAAIAYMVVSPYMGYLRLLPSYHMDEMLVFTASMTSKIVIGVTIAMFLIALLDYLYQRYEYMKNLRMTKQEVKDEYKQQEGDPLVKSKLRQIRSERARKRMMANVPKADVIITNPTHYAIALAYDAKSMKAPMVLAKGKDKVALRIKALAEEHRIPVFRNPPVARALFDNAELDKEIPLEYYAAVAKIIGYVYKMKGKVPKRK